jgi:16S rRNA (uracil1498-N3)-methyltransferase
MNRFFIDQERINQGRVHFPPDIAHQILNVLRLGEGAVVCVLDNQGHAHHVRLIHDHDVNRVQGNIITTESVTTEPATKISLCFGLTSRDKVELILQKATEVGVSAFYPFVASRTLVQKAELGEKKLVRWNRIIREAAEQSRRGRLPQLHQSHQLTDTVRFVEKNHERMMVAWESADPSQTITSSLHLPKKVESLALFVGPEGGFSGEEIQLLKGAGCEVISFGPRILRMETAAIVFPALILQSLGEM